MGCKELIIFKKQLVAFKSMNCNSNSRNNITLWLNSEISLLHNLYKGHFHKDQKKFLNKS